MRLIDADELKKVLNANCDTLCPDKNTNWCEHCCPHNEFEDLIDNAPTVEQKHYERIVEQINPVIEARPQGECKSCRHRDPEDKKCDCGGIERQGCPFPVSDDYFCKFYEKGGTE